MRPFARGFPLPLPKAAEALKNVPDCSIEVSRDRSLTLRFETVSVVVRPVDRSYVIAEARSSPRRRRPPLGRRRIRKSLRAVWQALEEETSTCNGRGHSLGNGLKYRAPDGYRTVLNVSRWGGLGGGER